MFIYFSYIFTLKCSLNLRVNKREFTCFPFGVRFLKLSIKNFYKFLNYMYIGQ